MAATSAHAQSQPSAPKAPATATAAPQKPATPQKPAAPPPPNTPPPKQPAAAARPVAAKAPTFHANAFGTFGYQQFAAKESFAALFGRSAGGVVGGGAQVWHRSGLFVQVEYAKYQDEGQRAFVNNGMIFPLGIPLTLELGFLDFGAGYKFVRRVKTPRPPDPKKPVAPPPPRRDDALLTRWQATPAKPVTPPPAPAKRPSSFRMTPYVGGGIGRVNYHEIADFAEAGENVSESYSSYHLFLGIEAPLWKWIGVNVEGRYRWVPDALGEDGISAEYGEEDLGGPAFLVKFTVGK